MKESAHRRALMSFQLFLLVFHLAGYGDAGGNIPGIELLMPPSHIALSGDLHIQIKSSSFPPLMLQLSRLEGNLAQPLTTFPVLPEARALSLNLTTVKIPCGYFSKGGQYYVLLKKQPIGKTFTRSSTNGSSDFSIGDDDSVITRSLDVRWPMPQLSLTPEHVQTYPETPVMAILNFPDVMCPPVADTPASAIPEFWLELHYCGHSLLTCDTTYNDARQNKSNVQVLYSEQVRGFPGRRVLTLRCELFGLAGHYALFLRPTAPTPPLPHTAAYVKAYWSEQFVFNVHARSIFPCDTHNGGITVLFQYPSCILAIGDRVRLFARLRANVASLAPPTSLEYVAEQRVTRGQHSLHFDCDLFTERYVEYCFVYVSQAITGAVADVRMDCVPTLQVQESDSGGWGPWTSWTPCSSTCVGGTRTRYRFCDSPPPRYGAKFCEGSAVETEKCGQGVGNGWDCFFGNGLSTGDMVAEIPEVQNDVGPICRCGCVVHLGQAKPKRLLATSSQSCPGRIFWLIQADEDHLIQFRVERFHLPCGTQWLKIRDGRSLTANLLADLNGAPDSIPSIVNSTGANLLLEFYSDEMTAIGQMCGGGFLAQAIQMRPSNSSITGMPVAQSVGVVPAVMMKLTAVHIAAIFFLSGLIIATALLGAQYIFRYRKYHIAQAEDQDSLADPVASSASISLRTRASSSATLLSEVISMTRLRPHLKTKMNKHSRLRESMNCEQEEMDDREREGDAEDEEECQQEVTLAKEETLSLSSTNTLIDQETSTTAPPPTTVGDDLHATACSLPNSPQSRLDQQGTLSRSNTLNSDKDKTNEKDHKKTKGSPVASRKETRRLSNVSTPPSVMMMTHVRASSVAGPTNKTCSRSDPGFYSPASILTSTATIRSTNAKETKEKRNREKLLAGGPSVGSDFSIANPDGDLEMDYYDYNVVNAGAAPGSYLGMDPAFLVWIPPLDESGEILPEDSHEMTDIRPKMYVDPGSNKESPEEEMLLPKPGHITTSPRSSGYIDPDSKKDGPEGEAVLSTHQGNKVLAVQDIHCSPVFRSKIRKTRSAASEDGLNRDRDREPLLKTVAAVHEFPRIKTGNRLMDDMEKETKVEKSPSVDSNILDEIRFADDDDDEDENDDDLDENKDSIGGGVNQQRQCNIELSYQQDSNILSSS